MRPTLDWTRDGRAWPHREASRFVDAGGLRWHVQQMGAGPVAVLVHGTGAATHSWRGLMPLLASCYTVIAMDLPGHGYTDTPASTRMSLPGMADAVAALIQALAIDVDLLVGHSAGAAIAAHAVLHRLVGARALAAINGAFLPLGGLPGLVFPPVARLMAATPLASHLFAGRSWNRDAVEKLIGGTGSTLDADGLALYGALVRNAQHAAGALNMMAHWDLRPLAYELRRLETPLALIVGSADRAVPPQDARRVRGLLPTWVPCTLDEVSGAGHLVHEERPAEVARLLLAAQLDADRRAVTLR